MNTATFHILDFEKIKEEIASFTLTAEGRGMVENLYPSVKIQQVEAMQKEVTEAVEILKKSASVPVHGLDGMASLIGSLNKGMALRPDQLTKLKDFLDCCVKMRKYMKDKEFSAPRVAFYVDSIEELPELANEIIRCIRNGMVDDYASKELSKIRKQIAIQKERLKEKVLQMVRSNKYKPYLQENVVSQRDGRYVIALKKEYRSKIKGAVLDSSASGATLFIEPEEISVFQEHLAWLEADEETEEQKILFYLTGLVESNEAQLRLAMEIMVHYDFLFAKAKYSRAIDGCEVKLNDLGVINLKEARHPLLGTNAIPLTLELGGEESALVITGPNTGGKTVSIKTVGLLTIMAQCGIHLPVKEGSEVSLYQKVLVDIGDGQSIVDNLSTFSSRIVNIIQILKEANERSLVLLDELGSGTDPAEGMGLATAILEQLFKKGSTLLATTHYGEIKEFADKTSGFLNGSMEFDLQSLQPTYRLIVGKGGESQAFSIALKLGIHPQLIERAHEITYKEVKIYPIEDKTPNEKKELEKQIIINKHQRKQAGITNDIELKKFQMGDNVKIPHTNEIGIVFTGPNRLGNYVVQVKGEKIEINHKRLELYIAANDLYPDNYDFDIIFKSKENRKKRNLLAKRHDSEIVIDYGSEA